MNGRRYELIAWAWLASAAVGIVASLDPAWVIGSLIMSHLSLDRADRRRA